VERSLQIKGLDRKINPVAIGGVVFTAAEKCAVRRGDTGTGKGSTVQRSRVLT